jgi:hypothetical protein
LKRLSILSKEVEMSSQETRILLRRSQRKLETALQLWRGRTIQERNLTITRHVAVNVLLAMCGGEK